MSTCPTLLFLSFLLLSACSSLVHAGDEANVPSAGCAEANVMSPSAQKVQQLPAAFRHRPYARSLRAEGGRPPYRFEVSDRTLAGAGLSLNPDGQILGRPTRLGEWEFTVMVRDMEGCQTAIQRYRLRVLKQASRAKNQVVYQLKRPIGLAALEIARMRRV